MKKEFMMDILLNDRYTKKEAEKAIETPGFTIYSDIKQAAIDYNMPVDEISKVDDIGLKATIYQGKTYIICYPM